MSDKVRALRAAEQLRAVLRDGTLPARLRGFAESLSRQIEAPVRLALIGRPGCGLAALANALLGEAILPADDALPPAEVCFGHAPGMRARMADGSEQTVDASGLAGIDPVEIAQLRSTAPLPVLEQVTLLTVPLEGGAEDDRAALAWAGRTADMGLWCTERLGPADLAHVAGLQAPLGDHCFLAVTGPRREGPWPRPVREMFRGAFHLDGSETALARMRAALLAHVAEGRREDIEGALLFLERHGHAAPRTGDGARPLPAPAPDDHAAARAGAGVAALLARRASDLADRIAGLDDPGAMAAEVLAACSSALDECAGLCPPGDPLSALVAEAMDLVLLMQLESSPSAMADSVALLLQLRHEAEQSIAA